MNDHRRHESTHPTAKDLWLTSSPPAGEYVVSHPDPSLLITSFFFFFFTTKLAAMVETLRRAIDTLTRCRI